MKLLDRLATTYGRWAHRFSLEHWRRGPRVSLLTTPRASAGVAATPNYGPLERVLLTDGVAHTLFEEYAQHRQAERGEEETGWVLLGLRDTSEAVVLATLPAGAEREASVAHVRFNSTAQALASRILRQRDRRLTILGVVHTHPGTLRHPSDGDLRGDREWIRHLRGGEGIFGIGTADGISSGPTDFAYQPHPNVQVLGNLRFSWYHLRTGENKYRPLNLEVTIGPDLARPLHLLWSTLEVHGERASRLARMFPSLRFDVANDDWGPALLLSLPLVEQNESMRVVIRSKEIRYYLIRGDSIYEIEHRDERVDCGVYSLLAELAAS